VPQVHQCQPPEEKKCARRVNDFCSAYGISRSTLYVLMKSGSIRTIKVGRRRLIPEDEGERLLKEGA
jgi:excisionase family DNA binding protein